MWTTFCSSDIENGGEEKGNTTNSHSGTASTDPQSEVLRRRRKPALVRYGICSPLVLLLLSFTIIIIIFIIIYIIIIIIIYVFWCLISTQSFHNIDTILEFAGPS